LKFAEQKKEGRIEGKKLKLKLRHPQEGEEGKTL